MAALLRLLQLLRVAEQNQAFSSRGTSQNVGKRHLACLIDEQNVHGIAELLSTPEPRSTPKDIHGTTLQTLQRLFIRTNLAYRSAVGIRSFLPVSITYLGTIHFAGNIHDLIKEL